MLDKRDNLSYSKILFIFKDMVRKKTTLKYNQIFNDTPRTIDEYLNVIDVNTAKKITSFILEKFFLKSIPNNIDFINEYFGDTTENFTLKEYVKNKVRLFESENNCETIIFSIGSLLLIMEKCINLKNEDKNSSIELMEDAFLKAILLQNSQTLDKEDRLSAELNQTSFDGLQKAIFQVICSQLPTSDVNNFVNAKVINTQIVKSCLFFEFMSSFNSETKELLDEFLKYYASDNWKNYLVRILSLLNVLPGSNPNLSISVVSEDDKQFINKFLITEYSGISYDYKKLRESPVYPESKDSYKIIFWLFIIEKIYKSLYFKFSEINDDKIPEFRSKVVTQHFSEQFLLYNIIEYIYPNATIKKSGKEQDVLKIPAPSDYYIRDNSNILLIECKDILFNAEKKHSYSAKTIIPELHKKLFQNQDGKRIGVQQLINSIKNILQNKYTFDKDLKINDTKIYPILVLHDRVYNTLGINYLANAWFMSEIAKLNDEGLNINQVKPLTIIDIDTLIELADYIKNNPDKFYSDLDKYFADKKYLQFIPPTNYDELIINCESFEYWTYDNIVYPKESIYFNSFLEKYFSKEKQ